MLPLTDETAGVVAAVGRVNEDVSHLVLVGLEDVATGVARLLFGRAPDSGDDRGRRPLRGNELMLERFVALGVD